MALTIAHRGPDGAGVFVDAEGGVALGHRRLSIIDLSSAGTQPMTSHDGRWEIVFNGEIYNYEEMRKALEAENLAPAWSGHSDTEVLLAAFAGWGIEKTLQQTNGMFAIAAWDRRDRRLMLARDRMGEKPLYYGWQGRTLMFGSELKALAAHPDFERKLDRGALALYLNYGYVPAPHSIFRGVRKLKPAHYVSIECNVAPGSLPAELPYWILPRPAPEPIEEEVAVEMLDSLLRHSIAIRMRADVPMGAFLSGGTDSSTVVALMQAQSSQPVRSFSIGFREAGYDESKQAAAVAAHLGTTHTEMQVSAHDALDVIPLLARMYDEPFADSSQIPTYLLSKLTREHVTVSLSGDAGDEVFAGYARYFSFDPLWRALSRIPGPLRSIAATALSAVPVDVWRNMPGIPVSIRREIGPGRLQKVAAAARSRTKHAFYKSVISFWDPAAILKGHTASPATFFDGCNLDRDFPNTVLGMSYIDMGTYLPDDILTKVDRAAMAVALEGRVPFLDHRIVEFGAKLPFDLKVKSGVGKQLLRRVLDRYVPRALIDRPKQGFAIPLDDWLRKDLRDWGSDLLADGATPLAEILDMTKIRSVWNKHQNRQVDESAKLWVALMALDWSRTWNPLCG